MSATPTAIDPNRPLLEAARTQIANNDLKGAALTLNKAQKNNPNDARIFMLAGLMAEKSGNIPGAFDALRRSVALAPDWGPGLLELSLLLARQNQFKEAIETAEKVAKLEPKNLQVLAGSAGVQQDTDGDGKPDKTLNDEDRANQRGLAEAAVKAYCTPQPKA